MSFYIILPDQAVDSPLRSYFEKIIKMSSSEASCRIVASGKLLQKLQSNVVRPVFTLSEALKKITSDDFVFNFSGIDQTVGSKKYFNLDVSTLNCCLYSCLFLKNEWSFQNRETCLTDSLPVELLSNYWYETLFAPDPAILSNSVMGGVSRVSADMSSGHRTRLAYRSDRVIADSLTTALEAILLGKSVNYPGMPSDLSGLRGHLLSFRLIPSSVFTDLNAFGAFISGLAAGQLVSDELLQMHHELITNDPVLLQKSKRHNKLRKLKRDPVLFFKDGIKNLFRKS